MPGFWFDVYSSRNSKAEKPFNAPSEKLFAAGTSKDRIKEHIKKIHPLAV
jgi:hypothetical protein